MATRKKRPVRKSTTKRDAPMIHVGATADSLAGTVKSITTVLDYKDHHPDVLVQALKCLKRACTVSNVTISNSNFESK